MNKKEYSQTVFIFRRDLRVDDNTGLSFACKNSDNVIPCFIFDKNQISSKNKFKSSNAVQFMLDSLVDLEKQISKASGQLYIFEDSPDSVIKMLIKQERIAAVFVNLDYTPYSKIRDDKIAKVCKAEGVTFKQFSDLLLTEPELVVKKDKKPYTIFTPFFKKASKLKIELPQKFNSKNLFNKKIKGNVALEIIAKKILKKHNNNVIKGGRTEALKILQQINEFENYDKIKDFPALESTSQLSAHHKFGTISIRESFYSISKKLGQHHSLVRQLYWRDFFTHVAYNFPKIFGHSFREKYDQIKWQNDKSKFEAWYNGKTGFPIIDAGMRQLNSTGFMHNRVRMVVASFLVKDLHIDWRWGEKYFATKLVDYDPSVNNGNWQWAASTGCDSQPYFRIFNPWLQQKKFDPRCEYIKKWIPELQDLSIQEIHKYFKQGITANGYPRPIIKHEIESRKWLTLVKKIVNLNSGTFNVF